MSPKLTVHIRWVVRRDMPEVLAIEQASSPRSWGDEDFLVALRQRNTIGMVAELNHRIVGFMVYELHRDHLHILKFAVDPALQRQRIGTQLFQRLVDKLSQQRRNKLSCAVPESRLAGQLFFKACGCRCMARLFGDPEEQYLFSYRLPAEKQDQTWAPENRITPYVEEANGD